MNNFATLYFEYELGGSRREDKEIDETPPKLGKTYGQGYSSRHVIGVDKRKKVVKYTDKKGDEHEETMCLWHRWIDRRKKSGLAI